MKNIKFKFENLEIYLYLIITTLITILLIFFYNFINTKVLKVISSSDIILDPATIRISDVNINRFEGIADKIKDKASSRKTSSRIVFE